MSDLGEAGCVEYLNTSIDIRSATRELTILFQFEITVKQVQAPVLPEVDAEFAKGMGIADGDIAKMRGEIEANLKREVKRRIEAKLKDQVMEALTGLEFDDDGYIDLKTRSSETNSPGVFAAGDVSDAHYRQAITAAGTAGRTGACR